jgi:hypothetical protein
MRRYVVPAVVAALLAAAPAGATSRVAATRNGIKDAAGDWPVASQDILDVRLSNVRLGRAPALRAVITLAAPADGVAQYGVGAVGRGCDSWGLSARNIGGGDLQDARLTHYVCGSATDPVTKTYDSVPAVVTVTGNTVTLTAPYAVGLKKGLRFASMSATATPLFTGVFVGHDLGQSGFVVSGDLALGSIDFTLR